MRQTLDDFWSGGPLVFMGDFNANPWAPEMTSCEYVCALREKDFPLVGSTFKRAGRDLHVVPLYNPMWHFLPDRNNGAQGTHSYVDQNNLRWHCFDQIIVSQDLREHCGVPEVLTSLCGHSLLNENGAPNKSEKSGLSDHLPVQMKIEIGKVSACQI